MTLTEALVRLHKAGKIKSPWRAGMLTQHGERVIKRISGGRLLVLHPDGVEHDGVRVEASELIIVRASDGGPRMPDLADAATRGALLDIAREAWGDPAAYASTESTESEGADWGIFTSGDAIIVHRASTEGDAIAAAIIAAAEALEAP